MPRSRLLPATLAALLVCGALVVPAGRARAEGPAVAPVPLPTADGPHGHHRFRTYGLDEGLANLNVLALAQDAAGFLWVATEDGLFRYDGQGFVRFGPGEGLPGDEVYSVAATPDGRLWVGTDGGLAVGEGGRFRKVGPEAGLPEGFVFEIAGRDDGTVVVSMGLKGLYQSDTGGRFAPVPGYPNKEVGAVWASADGREILAAKSTDVWLGDGQGHWERLPMPADLGVARLLRDRAGRLWVLGRRHLLVQERPGQAWRDVSAWLPGAIVGDGALYVDAQDRLWVPTVSGVLRVERVNGADRVSVLGEREGLPTSFAQTVLVDREGSLWVGSEGLHRVQGRLAWTIHQKRDGLPADPIWSILRDARGTLWVGTQNGLAEATADGWRHVAQAAEHLVYTVAEDAAGGLWAGGNLGTRSLGKLLYRPAGAQRWTEVPLHGVLKPGRQSVGELLGAREGGVWVGTLSQGLLRVVPGPGGRPTVTRVPLPDAPELEGIAALYEDPTGRLWVGTSRGLFVREPPAPGSADARWRHYTQDAGLSELHVTEIVPAPDGTLTLAYYQGGAPDRFRPADGRAAPLPLPPEALRDNVYSIGWAHDGALWLGTAAGVKRWDGRTVTRLGRSSGLPGDDCNAGALLLERDAVWVGMNNGLAHFQPRVAPEGVGPPPTYLTAVAAGERPAAPPDGSHTLLSSDERSVTFHVATPSYVDEGRVQLEVRLGGFEDAWRVSETRTVRYTALPPGDYHFEARARLPGGEHGAVASFPFRVRAPWWRRPWALALEGLLLAGLVVLGVRYRLGRLERENARLEAVVRARTRELEEATLLDPLTGAKNRRFLQMTLPDEVARVLRRWRDAGPGAALLGGAGGAPRPGNSDIAFFAVDLDHFKQVNDTHGHAAGDLVLQQVAAVLRATLRETDTLVRWGGEEFLVVAQQTDRANALTLAAKLRDAVGQHAFDIGGGQHIRRTCSVGFAAFPFLPGRPEALRWEEVVELADRCLYVAKRSGRDGWVGLIADGAAGSAPPPELVDGRPLQASDVLPMLVEQGCVQLQASFPPDRLAWRS